MHCYAILSFALHCIALHVHAFGRKNTPNWGRAGFIYKRELGIESLGLIIESSGLRIEGLGLKIESPVFRIEILGLRIESSGLRIERAQGSFR